MFFLFSVPKNKINVIKVIRSLLRENLRRNMKNEETLERCKEHLPPLYRTLPASAKLGELILSIYSFVSHLKGHKMSLRVFSVR